jgi:hypothetical protein
MPSFLASLRWLGLAIYAALLGVDFDWEVVLTHRRLPYSRETVDRIEIDRLVWRTMRRCPQLHAPFRPSSPMPEKVLSIKFFGALLHVFY